MAIRDPLGPHSTPEEFQLPNADVGSSPLDVVELHHDRENFRQSKEFPPQVLEPIRGSALQVEVITDLSTANIYSNQVLRASSRPERRAEIERRDTRRAAVQARLARLQERPALAEKLKTGTAAARASKGKPIGIFSNPHFKYRGGFFSKLLTMFANIIKFLETAILGLLSGRNNSTALKPTPRIVLPKDTEKLKPEAQKKLDKSKGLKT